MGDVNSNELAQVPQSVLWGGSLVVGEIGRALEPILSCRPMARSIPSKGKKSDIRSTQTIDVSVLKS